MQNDSITPPPPPPNEKRNNLLAWLMFGVFLAALVGGMLSIIYILLIWR